jgi:ubiquinone/menaquinone biosynthesis C-methylase UbiE
MSHGGASWLERPERDGTEQPDMLLGALHLAPDDTVADIGAGTGYLSRRIAAHLGKGGHVIATDIQPEMLDELRREAAKAHVTSIETVLATETDTKLADDTVDVALMVDVYHELAHPDVTLRQVRRALHARGRLVLVEYRAEDPAVPIKPEHKMRAVDVIAEVAPLGFRLNEQIEVLPQQHVMVFEKTAQP